MRYVVISGGLGNQMFMYAFLLQLRSDGKAGKLIFTHSKRSKSFGHQGYELKKIFSLIPEDRNVSIRGTIMAAYLRLLSFLPYETRLKLVGYNLKTVENFIYSSSVFDGINKRVVYKGTWQSERYFQNVFCDIRNAFSFNKALLSTETQRLEIRIKECNSISIHVRRDDYLSEQYSTGFGNICTVDYYSKAIQYIKSKVDSPLFFIFSDDLEWVKENISVENCVFVDFNRGENSWQDMYLMHCCKHNIIANSSFSWWAAWLNANERKIVVAPSVWWNGLKDDVVPDNWIRI